MDINALKVFFIIGTPVVAVASSMMAKKLGQKKDLAPKDYNVGPELCMAALFSAWSTGYSICSQLPPEQPIHQNVVMQLGYIMVFSVVVFFLLHICMCISRSLETDKKYTPAVVIRIGTASACGLAAAMLDVLFLKVQ